jgi:hypothetical protein
MREQWNVCPHPAHKRCMCLYMDTKYWKTAPADTHCWGKTSYKAMYSTQKDRGFELNECQTVSSTENKSFTLKKHGRVKNILCCWLQRRRHGETELVGLGEGHSCRAHRHMSHLYIYERTCPRTHTHTHMHTLMHTLGCVYKYVCAWIRFQTSQKAWLAGLSLPPLMHEWELTCCFKRCL